MKPVNAHEDETEGLPLFDRSGLEPRVLLPGEHYNEDGRPLTPNQKLYVEALGTQTIPYSNFSTSKAAAEEIAPHLGELEGMVLEAIKASADGLTCEQVEEFCALSHQCASARVRGLVLKGMIRDSGRTRKTISGRSAIVWEPVR